MKKILLAAFGLLILGLSMTSCKKCVTCTAYNRTDNTVYTQEQNCSRPVLRDSWEESFKLAYDDDYTYVKCEKD